MGSRDESVISCLVEWVDGDAARRTQLEKPWPATHTWGWGAGGRQDPCPLERRGSSDKLREPQARPAADTSV